MTRRLRKPLAMLLVLMLALSLCGTAFAAGTPTFTTSDVSGTPGDEVTVTVKAENNPGISSFKLNIAYDKAALTFKSIALASAYAGGTPVVNDDPDDLVLGMVTITGDIKEETLGTIVFTINDDAPGGASNITLTFDEDDVYDAEENNVAFDVKAGAVTVSKPVTALTLNKTSLSLSVGATETLTATKTPADASDPITWKSSDTAVATVSDGTVTAKAEGKATITATAGEKSATCEVEVVKDPLTGTAAITGTAKFGETLTASATGTPADATLAYNWVREGSDASIGTGTTYKLAQADIGKKVSVQVTDSAGKYNGTLTAQSDKVVKADAPAAPAAPTLDSKTADSIAVKSVAGGEYSKDGTTWQDSPSFTGLEANKEYTISVRIKETATRLGSAASSASFTTDKLEQTISAPDTQSVIIGGTFNLADVVSSNAEGATLTYALDGTLPTGTTFDVATGAITAGETEGSFKVKVNSAAVGAYNAAAEKVITINVTAKEASVIDAAFATAETKTYGDEPFTKAATLTAGDGAITYKSSDETVATVDAAGQVTIVNIGTADITATAAETEKFASATASYTLTVGPKTITITPNSKSITVGQAIPALGAEDYTVTGLVGSDKLTTPPTLAYATTPDNTVEGTYVILASGAAADAKYKIEYAEGKLTITADDPGSDDDDTGGTVVPTPPKPTGDGTVFTDVNEGDYFYDAVNWAVKNGVTNGTSAETFSPYAVSTRAQMVTFVWRASGSPKASITSVPFTDVIEGEYYYDAILWAYENGVTKGTSDTTFGTNDPVLREQAVTFLYRLAEGTPSGENIFDDVIEGEYYYDAVLWAIANNITKGISENLFGVSYDCQRGQIVTFMYRYFGV